ncbi:fibronectin type III domain-containing protein [Leifsonia sp. F6_8S_P_1B]|uniref:Fibronectin type III domain-containing protein n=1 Tax=Leifsonia williamsii TaxID=3035919 RepID=A0ABT8KA72_9MICO|nr:fibronectin type III domain-containing protein [Leifsonia williamsii]MDN4614336.1 fibronectin type III domain-containing protein [Leifsonia williamsii]
MRETVRRRVRRSVGAGVVVVVVSALTAFAIVNPGAPVAQIDSNDAGVWLTDTGAMKVGRYNHLVEELDGGVVATGTPFDVIQDGSMVLVTQANTVAVLDPATVSAAAPVLLPAAARVSAAAGVASVLDADSGSLWARPASALGGLDTRSERPDLRLGRGAVAVTARSGAVLAADAKGRVSRVDVTAEGVSHRTLGTLATAAGRKPAGAATATTVGDDLYVLRGSTLAGMTGAVDLSAYGHDFVLQQPGPARDTVVVATPTALLEVAVASRRVTTVEPRGVGVPAAPVVVGECVFGAWATTASNSLIACGSHRPVRQTLKEVAEGTPLVFRVNHDAVILNDTASGRLWEPQQDTEVRRPDWGGIANNDDKGDEKRDDQTEQTDDGAPRCDEEPAPPTVAADEFGVRPGRSRILPVLGNDHASGCGVLAVADVEQPPASFGSVTPVYGGRALQVTVDPAAVGTVTVGYTVSDGRPGVEPVRSTLTLTAHADDRNAAPEQTEASPVPVGADAAVGLDALARFSDPDGDDLVLVGARSEDGTGTVETTPAGTLTYRAAGAPVGRHRLDLTVSDGRETMTGTLDVDVRAAGSVAPTILPSLITADAGQQVRVAPLDSVRSVSATPVRLAGVEPVDGATVTPDLDGGTFTFSAQQPGSYYVPITVVAAPQQATGVVRVDVREAPTDATPRTAVDVVVLPRDGGTVVDPLANDDDPAGSVLVLQSVEAEDGARVAAVIEDGARVRLSADRALTAPATLRYTVSDGAGSAVGEIHVLPYPSGTEARPPIVPDVTATVAAGGIVTIPALAGARSPSGGELQLDDTLVEAPPADQGLLFVSGDVLRYQAPQHPMTVTAVFAVTDGDGNSASGRVTIDVHDADPATDAAPLPRDVIARVQQGGSTSIAIPLTGIDRDGDEVTLVGADTAPAKGRITAVGPDSLRYEALPGETGTDVFRYLVEDAAGHRATASIRVGIVPAVAASHVVAVDDTIAVRPGTTVAVPVLENDSAGPGTSLVLADRLTADDGLRARVVGDRIRFTAPAEEGDHLIGYTVGDRVGGTASATLAVHVASDAPILPPVVRDVVITAVQAAGRSSVVADVLAAAENPVGPASDLRVAVHPSALAFATPSRDGKVTVTLGDRPRVAAVAVSNRTAPDGEATAYAFVLVPAKDGAVPSVKTGAKALSVLSGERLTIPLEKYVSVRQGRTPRVFDPATVSATKADGSSLVQDDGTLVYRSATGYAGPASITFLVSDGSSAADPTAATRLLTLPITVRPSGVVEPSFTPGSVRVAPAEAPAQVDLGALTETAGPRSALSYRLSGQVPSGITASVSGRTLSIAADADARPGTSATLRVEVGYGGERPVEGTVEVTVVKSTARLASVRDVELDGAEGESYTVNVLDGALNPFPSTALRVTGATVETPGGGRATVDGSRVTVATASGFTGRLVVAFTVRDATGDADRDVRGAIRITVRGKPSTPAAPTLESAATGALTVRWSAPANNGSPIEEYRLTGTGGITRSVDGRATQATLTDLPLGRDYAFTVQARNAAGWSAVSASSAPVTLDAAPGAVPSVSLSAGDGSAVARWGAPSNPGTPLTGFDLLVSPAPAGTANGRITVDGWATSYAIGGLQNGVAYTVMVSARNRSGTPGPWSAASAPATPAGMPGKPTLSVARVEQPSGGAFRVDWAPGRYNGAPETYALLVNGAQSGVALGGSGGSVVVGSLQNGARYSFTVVATNRVGSTSSDAQTASTWGTPGKVTLFAAAAGAPNAAPGQGSITASWRQPTDTGGVALESYRLDVSGQNGVQRSQRAGGSAVSATVAGLPAGTYSVSIAACNAGDACGPASTIGSVTVVTLPDAVTGAQWVYDAGLGAYHVSVDQPSWNGGTSGTIQYRVGSGAWLNAVGTRFDVPAAPGVPITLTLRAVTSAGTGPTSTSVLP